MSKTQNPWCWRSIVKIHKWGFQLTMLNHWSMTKLAKKFISVVRCTSNQLYSHLKMFKQFSQGCEQLSFILTRLTKSQLIHAILSVWKVLQTEWSSEPVRNACCNVQACKMCLWNLDDDADPITTIKRAQHYINFESTFIYNSKMMQWKGKCNIEEWSVVSARGSMADEWFGWIIFKTVHVQL